MDHAMEETESTPLLQLLSQASAAAGSFNEEVLKELRSASSHAELLAAFAPNQTEQQFLDDALVLTEEEATSLMILKGCPDSRLLKDPVSGGVVCKNMDEVKQVHGRLERLTRKGTTKITGTANRFRGEPHSGGHRDLIVYLTYHEVPCKLQVGLTIVYHA